MAGKNTPDLTDGVWRFWGDDYASVGRIKLPSDPRFRNKRDTEDFGTAALLSETEIVEMVEYVLQLSAQPHDEAMARRAAVLFQDHTKGNCYDCHGRDGRGIAAFGSTDLTDRKMYLYGADRASIHESITKGRHGVMPGFDGVLKPEELKAVSVYTFSHAQK